MKKILIIAALVVTGLLSRAQFVNELYSTQSLAGENIESIIAETSGGKIEIEGGKTTDARIEVYVRSNNIRFSKPDMEKIRKRVKKDYDVSIEVVDNQLKAIVKKKSHFIKWRKSMTVSFKIYVPAEVSSELTTHGGTVYLSDLSGTQNFETSGGSLHVNRLRGKIHGNTGGGRVLIADSHDDIDLQTRGGSIHADYCTGDIKLVSTGGSMRINNMQGNIKANTSGGSLHAININGELSARTAGGRAELKGLRGSVDASTNSGSLQVEMLELGKYVTINNTDGNIDLVMPGNKGLDLDLRGEKIRTNRSLNNFNGKQENDLIAGTMNGGGIPVNIHTPSGKIKLTIR